MSNDLNSKINAVERDIASTANEIEETKNELKNPRDAAHGDFLMKRLLQLQDMENKLQDKENKLQDKENKLLDLKIKQTVSSEERTALLRIQILKEENRQKSTWPWKGEPYLFLGALASNLHIFGFLQFFTIERLLHLASEKPIVISVANCVIQYVIIKLFNLLEECFSSCGEVGGLNPAPAPIINVANDNSPANEATSFLSGTDSA